jgi:hypothetical protein
MVKPFGAALLIGVAGMAGGCSSDKECPPIAFAFFDVIVSDATTNVPVCDAQVRIQVDEIDYQIGRDAGSGCGIESDGRCHCVAWNGKLNAEHTVTVTASGYTPFAAKVFVKGGSCGPSESQSVEARLEEE